MPVEKCPKCNEFVITYEGCREHKCLPQFEVWHEEYCGSDTKTIFAVNHHDAAVRYGAWYDPYTADYPLLNGEVLTIKVRKIDEMEWKTFKVRGETVPEYYAKEV